MRKVIAALIPIFISTSIAAQTPESEMVVDGKGSYFYEEHHPMKFDFETMTFCGGRNSESENSNFVLQRQVRQGNSGDWDAYLEAGANKGILQSLINQKVQWNSSFDNKEYTFNVRLKKSVGRGHEETRRTVCNTRTWRYKVDSAHSRFNSSVRVAVPDHVYVVRVRTSVGNVTNVQAAINKVRSIGGVDQTPEELNGFQLSNGIEYFFVKPFDEISLQIMHDDAGSDVDLVADFEITFIGHNRCEKGINEFKDLSGLSQGEHLTRDAVAKAFGVVTDSVTGRTNGAEENLHRSMLFIGCLTSETVANNLIYDNSAKQTGEILDGLDDFSKRLTKLNDSKTGPAIAAANIKQLHILEAMARNAVASSVVRGMKPLCQRYPFVSDNRIAGYMTGYLQFRHKLDVIASVLGHDDIANYLTGLVKTLEQMTGQTYATLMRDRKAQLISLTDDYEANRKIALVEEAERQFQLLPPIEPSRDLVGMSVEMSLMKKQILRVNAEFNRQIDLFSVNSNAALDVRYLKAAVEQFHQASTRFQRHLKVVYGVFGQENASAFGQVMANLNDRHIETTREWLSQRYSGFLEQFAKFHKDKLGGDETAKELQKCIYQPVSKIN